MSISSISAYQQAQNWHAAQKAVTDNLMGTTSSLSSATDYSSAFTNVAANYYTSLGNLSVVRAVTNYQAAYLSAMAGSSTKVALDAGANAAKTMGNAILAQFVYGGVSAGSSSKSSGSSGTYTAPVNAATGYSYVNTSAASVGSLSALNMFA